jgi:putative ABC transport system substrate-binding protein
MDFAKMRPSRRRLLGGAAALIALGGSASARGAGPAKVAFVAIGFGADRTVFDVIRGELRALGQVEGQSYVAEIHVSDDVGRAAELAAEIVRSQPDLIFALDMVVVSDLQALTHQIPIVMAFTGDPIALGFTTDLARPTGNVTGILGLQEQLILKRLEILKALVPSARKVGVVYQSGASDLALTTAKAREQELALDLTTLGVGGPQDVGTVLGRAAAAGLSGIVLLPSPFILSNRQAIIDAQIRLKLPVVGQFLFEVEEGLLAAYGTEPMENFQRAAQYVDRLLRGERIASLPFDAPRNIRLGLNLRTARALGIAVPAGLVAAADEAVE